MKPKRSLGQHFLTSRAVVRDIIRVAALSRDDTVLEIGPGTGILTEALLAHAGEVIAVEKDRALVERLKERFASEIEAGRLTLVCGDILSWDPAGLKTSRVSGVREKPPAYTIVANIPYYITGEILRRFLSSDTQPERMVLLVQKEVAERIARDPKESILSLSVKAYGTPRYVFTVPAHYFKPQPQVDSAVLSVENVSRDFFTNVEEEVFFRLVKAGFAHKRKLLASNVQHLFEKNACVKAFKACALPEKARAEDVSLEKWRCLTQRTV